MLINSLQGTQQRKNAFHNPNWDKDLMPPLVI